MWEGLGRMPTLIEGQTLTGLRDMPPGLFEDIELRRCVFDHCVLSRTFDPSRRTIIRRVRANACEVRRVSIGGAIFDDVVVDGLKIQGLLQLWSPAFRHVVLRGRIGRLMISPWVEPATATKDQQRAFEDANRTFYESVDWGLDLREAELDELDLSGVPGRVVLRDPRDQAIVTRDAALRGEWRLLDLSGTWWGIVLEDLISSRFESAAFVAPRRHKKYKRLVEGIQRLRDAGIAEPD
jgi:hypothetical protein